MTTGIESKERQNAPRAALYAAVEVSRKSWVVALFAPGASRVALHSIPPADVAALTALVERAGEGLRREGGPRARVLCGYEAGYEGFWLARRLARDGIETLVLDPASLPVSRKSAKVKTDRVDATRMARALAAFDRGDPRAMRTVRVPGVEQEDRRRLVRERGRLVRERTRLANSIRGLLMLHGVFDLGPRSARFAERLDGARTGHGGGLPSRARAEIRRARALLSVVEDQIAEVEAERDRLVEGDGARGAGREGDPGAMAARLVRLRGVGANDAAVLAHEVFWREFRNRRELASWAGLAPAPWASGASERCRQIDKAGPPRVRAQLVGLAWRWLRHQPESALSKWFRARAGAAPGRTRQVFVIALARKLLVALWRYATSGTVPEGARLA